MLDLLIADATIIDGTGRPGVRGSVGVRDGHIVAVGEVSDGAAKTIEADGLVCCPGFVDPHTHYDAQLFWDPMATPSNLHGVTTIIGGNCGFGLAPFGPGDADYTRRMMANVEGMPLETLERGLDWSWSSFADYLDRLDGRIALNAAFLAGHCQIRRLVMGEAATGNAATPEQIDAMKCELAACLDAGGLGFSSSQAHTHRDGDGNYVASRFAARDEMVALAGVCRDFPGTTLEIIVDGCLARFTDDEVDLLTDMSLAANRPINWNVMGVNAKDPERHRHQLAAGSRAATRGGRIVALTMPTIGGLKMSFLHYCALHLIPGWETVMKLPVPERIAKLKDPEVRRELDRLARDPKAGILTGLSRWGMYEIGDTYSEANAGLFGRRVDDIARERGQSEQDTLFDIVIADDLATDLWPIPSDDDPASWAERVRVWRDPRAMIGGSDAGAHLDRMCNGRYTTAFLGDVCRDRGLFPLHEAVHLMTQAPAALFGLRDRGLVAPGMRADLVLFDPETVGAGPVRNRQDLPGDCTRLYAEAEGVHRVWVNGVEIVRDGSETGALPGTLLRAGRDTASVTVPGGAG